MAVGSGHFDIIRLKGCFGGQNWPSKAILRVFLSCFSWNVNRLAWSDPLERTCPVLTIRPKGEPLRKCLTNEDKVGGMVLHYDGEADMIDDGENRNGSVKDFLTNAGLFIK